MREGFALNLTRKCLKKHWEGLPWHIEVRRSMHDSNDFGNDGILGVPHSPTKTNDRHNAGCIALKVRHVILGGLE